MNNKHDVPSTNHEREIFEEALDITDTGARDQYISEACAGDDVLRARIRRLFEAHEAAGAKTFWHSRLTKSA